MRLPRRSNAPPHHAAACRLREGTLLCPSSEKGEPPAALRRTRRSLRSSLAASLVVLALAPACSQADAGLAARARYGPLMGEAGRRFEILGRSAQAGRWELAAYQAHEMGEMWQDELPRASTPHAVDTVLLRPQEKAFGAVHPAALEAAARSSDKEGFERAFAAAAGSCNACHASTGFGFVEIPAAPGQLVPHLGPVGGS